jgi:nucleoside-diphosphate-sugar epimerase
VQDVCDAFIRAAGADLAPQSQVINVASGEQTTLRSLVATARELFELSEEPEWGSMAGRSWDASVWVGDPRRAAEVLGWRPVTPLRAGLEQMAAWMRDRPEQRYRPAVATRP